MSPRTSARPKSLLLGPGLARLRLTLVDQALAAGERCVLVVHGKGLHSADEPVLRNALPKWLGDPCLEGGILAFVPAQPRALFFNADSTAFAGSV